MLDDVHIGAIWWPIQLINLVLLEPDSGQLGGVLRVIVLLEIYVLFLDPKVAKGPKKLVSKDFAVEFRIHVAINAAKSTQACGCDATPNHGTSTTMFDLLLHVPGIEFFPRPPPTPITTI